MDDINSDIFNIMVEHFRITEEEDKPAQEDTVESEDMKFIQCMAYKNVIYDPLDRAIINQEEIQQSTSSGDLMKLIQECKPANSKKFNAPFN